MNHVNISITPSWLYKIMSLTEKNPYKPQAWNKCLTNNYDIKNLIFSYIPSPLHHLCIMIKKISGIKGYMRKRYKP